MRVVLKDQVALVTGSAHRVGKAIAQELARAGVHILVHYHSSDEATLRETLHEIKSEGVDAFAVQSDVSTPEGVETIFAAVRQHFGRLNILVNSASNFQKRRLMEVTLKEWQETMNINLTGPFLCTQEAFRIMKAQNPRGGRIINNGSISAHAPRPNSSPYTTTKHAITGLTRASMLDGRKYDIAVGQIDIGNAATEMTDRMVQGQGVMQANGSMGMEPRMDVQHVADAIVHMAGLPLESNVLFMTIKATKMPFEGRG
jgi:NAD(P)-dependent dehydrogenase (short-subunit alcohol dehydrogenase family)